MPILTREARPLTLQFSVNTIVPVRLGSTTVLDTLAPPQPFWREGRLAMAARACAGSVGIFATSIIIGWYAQRPALVRLRENFAPVQFNAALCFVLAAAALATLAARRRRASLALSVSLLLLSGTTLAEHLFGWVVGIDVVLWRLGVSRAAMGPLAEPEGYSPGRMAPNSAVALTLLAAALVVLVVGRMNRTRLVVGAVGALAAAAAGVVALAGYVMGIPTAYGWGNLARMAPQSAVIIIVLGLGVLCGSVLCARRAGLDTARVTPGLTSATVAIAALLMWQALVDHDRRNLETAVRHQANAVASDVSRSVDARAKVVDRLVRQQAPSAGDSPAARSLLWSQVLRDFPGITAITWLDSAGVVTWRMAEVAADEEAVGSMFARTAMRAALLRAAIVRGRAVVSAAVAHEGREASVFVVSSALRTNGSPSAYLVVELIPETILADALPEDVPQLYHYLLHDDRVLLAGRTTATQGTARGVAISSIQLRDRTWRLTVIPTQVTLDLFASALPTTFLVVAVICALVAGWIVRSAQIAAEQSLELARTLGELAAGNDARREAETLRDEHADMLSVQAAELEIQYTELQATAVELADQRDELGRAQEFGAALVRSTVDAVAAFDREGRVHTWNPAMASLTGRTQNDVGHTMIGTLLPFLAVGDELRLFRDALSGRVTTMNALHASHEESHELVSLDLTMTPMRSGDGTVVGGLLVVRDVTQQQRDAKVILASKEAAEQASRAKSDFLARMSHELRTPLNAVIGFTNVIRRNTNNHLGKSDITYLERIGANGRHLLTLINTVLDLSKIESGRETVELAITPISTLVRDTVAELDVRATEARLQLHLVTPWGAEATTDGAKLKQVLINLVSNAIKFTPHDGHIFVRVETDPFTGVATRIDVEDSGIGIPADRHQAIFEAFEQADSQTAHTFGGTGLGLSISRKLCVLMGHELTVESEPGKGSKFSVVFRAA